jgi:hypothetical protein
MQVSQLKGLSKNKDSMDLPSSEYSSGLPSKFCGQHIAGSSTDSSRIDGQGSILKAQPFCANGNPFKKKKKKGWPGEGLDLTTS